MRDDGDRRTTPGRSAPPAPVGAALTLLLVGGLVRVALARSTVGNTFDLRSYEVVAEQLRGSNPFDLYAIVNQGALPRWPYLPGYLPVVWLVSALHGPVSFATAIRFPVILADLLLAVLVADLLRRRGASRRTVLLGLACVAVGPTFVVLAGHHGQLDAFAILPAFGALWLRARQPARFDLGVGLLLGLAIACKTAPALVLLAFVPATPGWPRRLRVLAATAAVPLAASLPFLLATPTDLVRSVTYRGLPGIGGFSVLVQPDLASRWMAGTGNPLHRTAATDLSQALAAPILLTALAVAAVALHRADRPLPVRCAWLWAVFFAFSTNFSIGYAVWAIPFVIVGASVTWGWVVHAALAAPIVVAYGTRHVDGWPDPLIRFAYVPYILLLQLGLLVLVVRAWSGRAALTGPRAARGAGRSRANG